MFSLPTRVPNTDLAVSTQGLQKRYGKHTALRDLALQVPVGSVYLLVGPNGAGKSTTLKILLDLTRADAGTAQVFGWDVRSQGAQVRANIGYVPEHGDWGYGWMRVDQLLRHHAQYFPSWDTEYAARLSKTFQLRLDTRLHKLSKGQARRVHLVMSLAHRPPLLLLDEPTDGLDPLMRNETLGILAGHLAETQTTVILSTHHVEEVERMADHIAVLRDGELRVQVSTDELRRQLRRYRLEIPTDWSGASITQGTVLHRVTAPREVEWTIWGAEQEIIPQLISSGASVRDITPLSLIDAAVILLNPQDNS